MQNKEHHFLSAIIIFALIFIMIVVPSGCYQDMSRVYGLIDYQNDAFSDSASASFSTTYHYSRNYNFVVNQDSIYLLRQLPEEALNGMQTDSITVYRHDHLAVADIRIIPQDSIDSVWVEVARDQDTFGWIHESELLKKVVPNDPISKFIAIFSNIHLLIFLIIISVISVAYLMRTIFKRGAKIVHFNDINSFYPTLFALLVALAATLYSSIQLFSPEVWLHFYFHPTLNPFIAPLILAVFLICVWAIIIVGIATIDVVRTALPTLDAVLYICGLAGVSAINYIIFSITTLYYVGYLLFIAYCIFAVRAHLKNSSKSYLCGNCGARLSQKGICPNCGAENK